MWKVPSYLCLSYLREMDRSSVTFLSDRLTLEGLFIAPDGPGRFPGVVLCHPHPLYGGDMRNAVIEHLSSALAACGIATLAFNFRGVGGSEGTHDRGVGEVADALAAVDYLAQGSQIDRSVLGIAGYSFGAGIALDAIEANSDLMAVATVACPLAPLNDMVLHKINHPKLFIQGDTDYLIQIDLFRFLVQRFQHPREVEVLQGAEHSLIGYEAQVGALAADFFKRTLV